MIIKLKNNDDVQYDKNKLKCLMMQHNQNKSNPEKKSMNKIQVDIDFDSSAYI
jgi:hypothetical protein